MKTALTWMLPALIAALPASAQDDDDAASTPPVQVAKAVPAKPGTPAPEADGKDDSPVHLPALDHYARLWTESLFTTRALPMPDVPAGPSFVDNYTLSGTMEDHGKMTAILIDKTTSTVVTAYIGMDNEAGFRISKIEPGDGPDKMRIQLQKGNKSGWLGYGDTSGDMGGVAVAPPSTNPAPRTTPPFQTPGVTVPPPPQRLRNAGPAVPRALPYQPAAAQQPVMQIPAQQPGVNLRGGAPEVPPTLPGDPPLPPP